MDEEFTIPASGAIPYKYFRVPTGPDRRQVDSGDRDQAGRARAGAPRDRVHAAGRQPLKPGGELGPTNIGGVTPEQAGAGVRAGRGAPAARQLGHRDADSLHDQRHGRTTDRTTVGVIYAKQPPTRMAARRHGDQPALRDSRQRRQRRGAARSQRCCARHDHHGVDAAHARARQGHDLHRALSGRHVARRCCRCRSTTSTGRSPTSWRSRRCCRRARSSRSSRTTTTRPSNKFNPDPTKDVRWGDQTWEEMMIGFFSTVAEPAAGSDRAAATVARQPLKYAVRT